MSSIIKALSFFAAISLLSINLAFGASFCTKSDLIKHPEHILECYVAIPETIEQPWQLDNVQYDKGSKVTIKTFILNSQVWPKPDLSAKSQLWQHKLVIYVPEHVGTDHALLLVNGGTRTPEHNAENPNPNEVFVAKAAASLHSVLVDLQDIPNQYITFDDGVPRKEDGIIAYTWNRYLDNADDNYYWPAHLAMTKAVVKAMDAVQAIEANDDHVTIRKFVIAGASKRGWTTWLTTLVDDRVCSIVPIVIDILNTKKNIEHIYASYDQHWPEAFRDYVEQGVTERRHLPAFDTLMKIEDPIAYLQCHDCKIYEKRLSKLKYIINASGDDFFVPDSLNLYIDLLPGETMVRILPNQRHSVDVKIVAEALIAFYRTRINDEAFPQVKWRVNKDGVIDQVTTDRVPTKAKLWEAVNEKARDFRYASNIRYTASQLNGTCSDNHCEYTIEITPPSKGFKASFAEFTFKTSDNEEIVLTTPAYITKKIND